MSFSDGVVYYHYTDQSSAHIIKKTRKILESTDTVNDAMLGHGVYFTRMDLQNKLEEISRNNYAGQGKKKLKEGKLGAVFEIVLSSDKVRALDNKDARKSKRRDVHVYPDELLFDDEDVKRVNLHLIDENGKVTNTIVVK